jgi:RHS repeat-associated protein
VPFAARLRLDGTVVVQGVSYQHTGDGTTVSVEVPHPQGEQSPDSTTSEFDFLGNLTKVTRPTPDGGVGTVEYAYGTVLTAGELTDEAQFVTVMRQIDEDGVATLSFSDALGRTVRTERGADVRYIMYGAFSHVTDHMGVNGSETIHSDPYGRILSVSDADLGTVVTTYDGLDRPRQVLLADSSRKLFSYDQLNRVQTVLNSASIQRFYYDHDPIAEQNGELPTANSQGRLVRTQNETPEGLVEEVLRYESPPGTVAGPDTTNRGLLRSATVIADGEALESRFDYLPGTGRIAVEHYPDANAGPFAVRYCYDAHGDVERVQDALQTCETPATTGLFWHRVETFRGMAVSRIELGNQIKVGSTFDPKTYALLGSSVERGNDSLATWGYAYKPSGLLHEETRTATAESLDFVRRYAYSPSGVLQSVKDVSAGDPGDIVYDPQYDDNQRLEDVARGSGVPNLGAFTYEEQSDRVANRPTSIGDNVFHYDGRGNQTYRDGPDIAGSHQIITYNDFNLPRSITTGVSAGAPTIEYQYDAGGTRALTTSDGRIVHHAGDYFEKRTSDTAGEFAEEHRYYVFANGERIAEVKRTQSDSDADFEQHVTYLHHDRLGSLFATTNESGDTIEEFEYGLFGEPQQLLDVPYGYTDYRHEQDIGLVDAHGRFYDPKFGLFLSADPIGPISGSSPYGNRYAYVGYDPVNRVDPSGLDASQSNLPQGYDPPPPESVDCASNPAGSGCHQSGGVSVPIWGIPAVVVAVGVEEYARNPKFRGQVNKFVGDAAGDIGDAAKAAYHGTKSVVSAVSDFLGPHGSTPSAQADSGYGGSTFGQSRAAGNPLSPDNVLGSLPQDRPTGQAPGAGSYTHIGEKILIFPGDECPAEDPSDCQIMLPILPAIGDLVRAGAAVWDWVVGAEEAAETATPIGKNSVIEGFRVSNHAWRKSGLGRGATEELVSGVIRGARKAGTVIHEVGTGKFAGNTIEIFVHDGVKVAVDTTRRLIMSIRPVANNVFKLP